MLLYCVYSFCASIHPKCFGSCDLLYPAGLILDADKCCVVHTATKDHITVLSPYCGKLFKTKRDLVFHVAVHTGARLYSCRHCLNKLFVSF